MSTNGENCIFRQMGADSEELKAGLRDAAERLTALAVKADPDEADELAALQQHKPCLEDRCDLTIGSLLRDAIRHGDVTQFDKLKTEVAPDCELHDTAASWFDTPETL